MITMAMREIQPEQLGQNVFQMIGQQWTLITTADLKQGQSKVNAMTASWGGLGVLWSKNVAYIFIRPQRYTHELLDSQDTFTLGFLPESCRKALQYCGAHSGRGEDKLAACGLHGRMEEGIPLIDESEVTLVCRKLYRQDLSPDCFLDKEADARCYPGKDYHTMYVGEIIKVLVKE